MEQLLSELSELRKKSRLFKWLGIGLVVLGGLTFVVLWFVSIVMIIAGVVLCIYGNRRYERRFKSIYKEKIVRAVLEKYFTNLVFEPDRGIPEEFIKSTEMIRLGNRYSSEDYISGEYKGTRFAQADVCIREVTTSSDGDTSTTTYFDGQWITFEFNKKFACDLQVRDVSFIYAITRKGFFSNKMKRHKLEMEDSDFERRFDVYAADDHEAYYILTPHMMKAMLDLRNKIDEELLFCFLDGNLHVAVNNGSDSFEPPSSLDEQTIAGTIGRDIALITEFVDELRLERSLFKEKE